MAWPEEHCSRKNGHAPHAWKKFDVEDDGTMFQGWKTCDGMEMDVKWQLKGEDGLLSRPCPGKSALNIVHSPHHWEDRNGGAPVSHWCPGLLEAFARTPLALQPFPESAYLDVLHCGSTTPHDGHRHNGPVSPDVEPRAAYWCVGQPEYDHPEMAESTRHIVTKLLPELADKVIRDARHYGGLNHRDLGQRGQFVEINGKVGPLRRALWEGQPTVREPVREMAQDLIGHCLLLIEMIDNGVSLDGS
jgi:hypothetical protein